MNCNIIVTDNFKRDAKCLLKKFASLKDELAELHAQLEQNPRMGTLIAENIYKIRLSVKSKGKGKSGGMRIISYVIDIELELEMSENETVVSVYLLTIYDKSEMENVDEHVLKAWVEEIQDDFEKGEPNLPTDSNDNQEED